MGHFGYSVGGKVVREGVRGTNGGMGTKSVKGTTGQKMKRCHSEKHAAESIWGGGPH